MASRKRPRVLMSGSCVLVAALCSTFYQSTWSLSVQPCISRNTRSSSNPKQNKNKNKATRRLVVVSTSISSLHSNTGGTSSAGSSNIGIDQLLDSKNLSDTILPPWLTTASLRDTAQLEEELQWLQWELKERHIDHTDQILQALPIICQGRTDWMLGCIDFLHTLLQLDEVATPTVLLASMVHYVECVMARMEGVYDAVQQRLNAGVGHGSNHPLALPPSSSLTSIHSPTELLSDLKIPKQKQHQQQQQQQQSLPTKLLPLHEDWVLRQYTPEVLQLSNSASQIKRAEIIAEVALPRQTDYEKVQNLLVSVTGDDWRALAIRCVASLYRLTQSSGRHPQTIATARYAIHVYAPLAQRMGLHVLKTQLESKAFGILYPRQYKAALSLFERQGESMRAVSRYLQQQIMHLIQQDSNLDQATIQVTARVKEPYSFWKKLLRKQHNKGTGRSVVLRFDSELSRRELHSILQVRDGVALRVIVQAPQIPNELDHDRRTRDQLLCYYVHQLIRAVFPETSPSRVKDYIASPKPNGYQSLHHTSVIRMNQLEIPFEIQVRSQEMHRIAEYGLAAHWDYKQQQPQTQPQQPQQQQQQQQQQSWALPSSVTSLASSSSYTSSLSTATSADLSLTKDTTDFMISENTSNTPYLQALEIARKSLVESSVFVFVAGTAYEHGTLVSVQKGQRIGDVWTQLSERRHPNPFVIHQVWRNGRLADMEEQVQNGDVLLFQEEEEEAEDDKNDPHPLKLLQGATSRTSAVVPWK